jgi:acetyl esterase/lipase
MNLDPEMSGLPIYTPETYLEPEERQKMLMPLFAEAAAAAPVPTGMEITERSIGGPADNPRLAVRIYRPAAKSPLPALLYFHGGGFAIGNLDSEHGRCIQLADGAQCVVISVDYRLAPKSPYPAAVDDAYAALIWFWTEGDTLNCDAKRIAVGGTSAGGCIAAATALASRDRAGPSICYQLLNSPVLDDRLDTPSARDCTSVPVFARFQAERMWSAYLGSSAGVTSPYAAPARATTLRGLPPAFILAAGLDPLRDEGIAYASRLLAEGVAVELHVIPGVPHGFDLVQPFAVRSRQSVSTMQNALRMALASTSS